jgi:hypothetical protein
VCSDAADGKTAICTQATSCTKDSECSADLVCSKDPRGPFNDPPGSFCLAPCATDDECAPTDKCDDGGHCRARTCAECPTYFSCNAEVCETSKCTADRDCQGGYCVNNRCAGALGTCELDHP